MTYVRRFPTDTAVDVFDVEESDARYLLLDQTTPQSVTGGIPVFSAGIGLASGTRIVYNATTGKMEHYVNNVKTLEV